MRILSGDPGDEITDHRLGRRLCPRRERQCRCRTAEQRDELAPPHVLPSSRGSHPTTLLKKPCCASQHLGPPDFRNGSESVIRRRRLNVRITPKRWGNRPAACGYLKT